MLNPFSGKNAKTRHLCENAKPAQNL